MIRLVNLGDNTERPIQLEEVKTPLVRNLKQN
jgi:hypothetical protein